MYQQSYIKEEYKKVSFWIINFIILLIAIVVGWMIFTSIYKTDEQKQSCVSYEQKNLQIGEKIVKVDISDSDCKRTLGLSNREMLEKDSGMLFIFPEIGNYGFWMKDMNFSIDILWIDEKFNVVGIERRVSSSTYPEIFGKKYLAKYVLELSSGFSEKNNIEVGNKIIFSKS